jgi:glycosyltransferase involved in cell wall biosynthesis
MKLTFVTPVNIHSAIARSTNLVVNSLKKLNHSTQIINAEWDEILEKEVFSFAADAVHWREIEKVEKLLTDADIIIYQIGNYYAFHAGCLALMKRHPGLIVLHDFFVANLFIDYFHFKENTQDTLHSQLENWYGENITKDFFSLLSDPSFFDFASQHAPMTESIACMAKGVISHSLSGIERMLKACAGPIACIPLPYDAPYVTSIAKNASNDRKKIITFGHINTNKRARSIITAIGKNALLKAQWTYHLVGLIEDHEKKSLQILADNLDVDILFTGVVNDQELAQKIVDADIVSCLRYPVLEGFSASTIEAMLYGKIVMVTDTSFYQDFPDDCVIKIPLESEIEHIQICLESYLDEKNNFQNYGLNAQAWANKTFNADSYAQNLIKVATRILVCEPIRITIQNIANDLLRWGVDKDSAIVQAITEPMDVLSYKT